MKKFSQQLCSATILCVLLISCSSDDVKDLLNVNSPLVGTTWTLSSETNSGCTDPNDNGTEACTTGCDIVLFNANGTVMTDMGPIDYTTTATTITVTFDDGGTPVTEVITYVILLNQLTLTFPADVDDGCISVEVYTGS